MSEQDVLERFELTEEEKELVRTAQFGNECQAFVDGVVGQFIFGRINEMEESCDRQLRYADPTNLKLICDLQVRARAAAFLKDWILEAVRAGEDARHTIDEEG